MSYVVGEFFFGLDFLKLWDILKEEENAGNLGAIMLCKLTSQRTIQQLMVETR